MKRVSYNQIKK